MRGVVRTPARLCQISTLQFSSNFVWNPKNVLKSDTLLVVSDVNYILIVVYFKKHVVHNIHSNVT